LLKETSRELHTPTLCSIRRVSQMIKVDFDVGLTHLSIEHEHTPLMFPTNMGEQEFPATRQTVSVQVVR
jgi:hypothetical protein